MRLFLTHFSSKKAQKSNSELFWLFNKSNLSDEYGIFAFRKIEKCKQEK